MVAGCLSGCFGPSEPPAPHLNYVNGHIVFSDGKIAVDRADRAVIEFHSADGSETRKICGTIIDGTYQIFTDPEGENLIGAPEGEYVVTITPSKDGGQPIPRKYTNKETSGLDAVVVAGINNFDFELAQ
jgi:hypothetical protein